MIPFDFTGLRSAPERIIDHLLGAHHDGNQMVFDLEILTGHGKLDELRRRVDAVLDGSDPRAKWLRDLTVYIGYHERLARAAHRGPTISANEANDPDKTLRGLVRWCALQPDSPAATFAAWRDGRFRIDSPIPASPTREALLAATRSELAAYLAAGHPIAPEELAGAEYRGTSLGLPAWVDRALWKTFMKTFVADPGSPGGVRGFNTHLKTGRRFGNFVAKPDGARTILEYDRILRDPLVALDAGSPNRLLGVSVVDIAGLRLPTPSYFLLERS